MLHKMYSCMCESLLELTKEFAMVSLVMIVFSSLWLSLAMKSIIGKIIMILLEIISEYY